MRSGIPQSACSARPKMDANFGTSASLHTAGLKNSPAKGLKIIATKSAVAMLKETMNLGCVFQDVSRRNLHRLYGRAQLCGNLPDVFDSLKPHCAMPKSETKIHRSTKFAQVNHIRAAPTLQNLRIGLRRRQSGKGIGLAKQRGGW